MGARAHGMANASSCLSDVWSLHNNVAGLAETERAAAGFSYHAVPSSDFFNRMAAVIALPLKPGTIGTGLFRFGDDLYSEQIVSLGFANTFGLASLGAKVNCLQYRAGSLETRTAFTVSFGGIASLTPQLSVGAHIVNINQPVINDLTGERLPTRLFTGLAFKPSEKLFITSEIEKDLEYAPAWRSGLEYIFVKKIAFRTGFQIHPQAGFFGLGFNSRRIHLDYAVQINDRSGLSHQATATFHFQQR